MSFDTVVLCIIRVQQSEHNSLSEVAHKPSYAFSTRPSVCTNPDGEAVLKGLVEELSSIK